MPTYKLLLALVLVAFSTSSVANYTLPAYEKTQLKNGLTLYLMEQDEVPLIDVNLVVKAGAIADGTKAGLATVTADNLLFGTKQKTKAQVNDEMDFIGANLSSYANLEFSAVTASFAKKDQQQVLQLIKEMVLAPRFEQSEFDKSKQRHLLGIEQSKESPKSVIGDYFNKLTFGETGYGALVDGNAQSIEALKLSDVKAFHKTWYQPENAALVIVGDFDAKAMKKQVTKLFGKWQNHSKVTPVIAKPMNEFSESNVLLVNKGDARESTFLIGGNGIARRNQDSVGISVINTILGARFTSWLNDELRVNAGLTYGARSRFSSYSNGGSFTISTFTRTETTIEAIDLALKTYSRLWEKGIDEKTLASAKAYVKGQFPPRFETSSQLADLLSNMYGYNFDEQYINTFEQQVNSLDTEKTKALIAKYFPTDNLQYVVIGNASEIKTAMEKYGKVKEVDIKAATTAL